jgi:hypothetical protein
VMNNQNVVLIVPYTKGIAGIPETLGIIYDKEKKIGPTILNREIMDSDLNSLSAAMRELEISTGYKVVDEYLWMYVGNMYNYISDKDVIYDCYFVDVTNIPVFQEQIENYHIDFKMIPLSDFVQLSDVTLLATILQFYKYLNASANF